MTDFLVYIHVQFVYTTTEWNRFERSYECPNLDHSVFASCAEIKKTSTKIAHEMLSFNDGNGVLMNPKMKGFRQAQTSS